MGVKALCRQQLDLSIFTELCDSLLQQWILGVSLWKATYCLGNSLNRLEISMEPLWPTTQLNKKQSAYQKLCLVTRDGKLVPHLLHHLGTSLGSIYTFQEVSIALDFHTTPQIPLNSSCFSLPSVSQPHLLPSVNLNLLFQSPLTPDHPYLMSNIHIYMSLCHNYLFGSGL